MTRPVTRALGLSLALVWAAAAAGADATLTRLYDLLAIDDYVAIARAEGLADADTVSQDMLGRPADAALRDQLDRIYDPARMQATVMEHLARLDAGEIAASVAFFQSEIALRITELEVAARRAMSDEDVEQSARLAWVNAEETRPELVARIEEIAEANDLVERNVSGALNSNLRFYQGLADGGGLQLSEAEILAEVWAQEEEIRADTEAWLGGYFLLSYQPLEAGDLEAYLQFWQTPPGQALNRVIFEGFNQVYDDISYATGRVVALNMTSQEL